MLRDDGLQPDEPQAPLSPEAQLLLRVDHDRGLHAMAVKDCDLCAASDLAASGMAPATN